MNGCETGCCGYRLTREDGSEDWTFEHPDQAKPSDEDLRAFARATFEGIAADDFIEIGEWRNC